ncbi:MAG: DUF3313 family protein [Asticcacaulis sp.]
MFLVSALTLSACQTAPTEQSGQLSSYSGVWIKEGSLRTSISVKRDDAASDAVQRVFIEPGVLANGVGEDLTDAEKRAVLSEVDRQICFEISERFTVVPAVENDTAIIRAYVVRIKPTGRVGSGASAAVNFFNPVPGTNVRAPGSTGGLAIESEMLAPNSGEQIAALAWGRDAQVLGTDSPSLSRIGDALQLAEPAGDAVASAFATKTRKAQKVQEPDPCEKHGPRRNLTVGSMGRAAVGGITGLYVPDTGDETPVE